MYMFFEKNVHVFSKRCTCFAKNIYIFCRRAGLNVAIGSSKFSPTPLPNNFPESLPHLWNRFYNFAASIVPLSTSFWQNEALCLLVKAKPEKLLYSVSKNRHNGLHALAWGCYICICLHGFSQGLLFRVQTFSSTPLAYFRKRSAQGTGAGSKVVPDTETRAIDYGYTRN